jgi:hypothetical protein
LPDELAGQLKAEPITIAVGKETALFKITPAADLRGLREITVRATALQEGRYAVVSETVVAVEFLPAVQTPRQGGQP